MSGATTPIIPGFHPDPTICRVDNTYYLANSSFEYFPGAPIFRSTDLIEWTQIGNILSRRSQFRRGDGSASAGIYGSTLRHHRGRFWFITTNVSDFGSGQVLVHASDPAGEWSEPIFVAEATGIDPDLCWDDDGTCYLTWRATDFATDEGSILQAPIDLATGRFTAPAHPVWQGSGMPGAEGPHLYHLGNMWYLLLAEGGTERGHCVTIARADRPQGPFEACPANPILTRRSTFEPVQSVGHSDLVRGPGGRWAAVYLGTRPRGWTPGYHVLGRETFLAGIEWADGWPVFDPAAYDVPSCDTSFTDAFGSPRLHPRWVVPGGEADTFAELGPDGLAVSPSEPDESGLLCFRVADLRWKATATVSGPARFVLRVDGRHWYALSVEGTTIVATAKIGHLEREVARVAVTPGSVRLLIASVDPSSEAGPRGHAGPDDIVLAVVDASGVRELCRLDGRYLSTEVASGFTGRMLGIGSAASPAIVHSVAYEPAC